MGVTHFDEARAIDYACGHIQGHWTLLGESAGSVGVGVRRIQLPVGGWSTPAHDHGEQEEIFYVLGGTGILWHGGRTAAIGEGDCLVTLPRKGGHSLRATEPLDVLAFGPRTYDEAVRFPRLEMSLVNGRFVSSQDGVIDRLPFQFVKEAELGPPPLPEEPGPRPRTIVNVEDVEPRVIDRARVARTRRNLGVAAGSVTTGLQHVEVRPGMLSAPFHCHSTEEELFVVLAGEGTLLLDGEGEDGGAGSGSGVPSETPVGPGTVVSRPAATGVAHAFRAGPDGLTYLAYGTREPDDLCWYPTSRKIGFGGLGIYARVEPLDYWDGED
jgi:uncharacterized cupin superfamily protein